MKLLDHIPGTDGILKSLFGKTESGPPFIGGKVHRSPPIHRQRKDADESAHCKDRFPFTYYNANRPALPAHFSGSRIMYGYNNADSLTSLDNRKSDTSLFTSYQAREMRRTSKYRRIRFD